MKPLGLVTATPLDVGLDPLPTPDVTHGFSSLRGEKIFETFSHVSHIFLKRWVKCYMQAGGKKDV